MPVSPVIRTILGPALTHQEAPPRLPAGRRAAESGAALPVITGGGADQFAYLPGRGVVAQQVISAQPGQADGVGQRSVWMMHDHGHQRIDSLHFFQKLLGGPVRDRKMSQYYVVTGPFKVRERLQGPWRCLQPNAGQRTGEPTAVVAVRSGVDVQESDRHTWFPESLRESGVVRHLVSRRVHLPSTGS